MGLALSPACVGKLPIRLTGEPGVSSEAEHTIMELLIRNDVVAADSFFVSFCDATGEKRDAPDEFLGRFSDLDAAAAPGSRYDTRMNHRAIYFELGPTKWLNAKKAEISVTVWRGGGGKGYMTIARWSGGTWVADQPHTMTSYN
jgi:hypothetical protein